MAAITPDATSNGLTASGTSLTVSHTITTNTNRVLWVTIIGSLGASDLISGVTYAGVAMTFVKSVQISGNRWSDLWKLVAPATGTNNIVATSSSADRIELYAASYYGVRQTTQPEQVSTNTTTASTSITGTVTTYSKLSWLIGAFNPAGTFTSVGAGAFARSTTSQGGGIYDSNAAYGLGSESMTINMQADPTTIIMATMEPVGMVTDGLVAYYPMAGNSTDVVGANNGSDTAITYSLANGKIGQGAGMNGTSSTITSASSAFAFTSAISLSCWINPAALPTSGNFASFLARFTNSAGLFGWDLRLQNTSGTAQINWHITQASGTNVEAIYNTALTLGTWVHVVAVNDGVNSYLYLNGVQVATASGGNTGTATNNLYLGAINYNAGVTRWFDGEMDEVGIWLRALSASEVTQLFNNGSGLAYPFGGNSLIEFM